MDPRPPTTLLLPAALLIGLLIALVDSSPGWDDTGISAGLVFGAAALFGAARPQRAWRWALAVGGWIPALGIARDGNGASLLALVFAFGGAYAGALIGRALRKPGGAGA